MIAIKIGSVVDGWRLERSLGAGTYGKVFEVKKNEVEGAMKIFKTDLWSAKLESGILKDLSASKSNAFFPSFLASSVDSSETPKVTYIVLSLEAENLQDVIDSQTSKRMSRPRTLSLLFCILNALKELHSRGYCHQDIKPGNLLCSRTSGKARIILADFGICTNLTNTGPSSGVSVDVDFQYNGYNLMRGSRYTYLDDIIALIYVALEIRKENTLFIDEFKRRRLARKKVERGDANLSRKNEFLTLVCKCVFGQKRRDESDCPQMPDHLKIIDIIEKHPDFEKDQSHL